MLRYNPQDRVQEILERHTGDFELAEAPAPTTEAVPFLIERTFLGQHQPYGRNTTSGKLNTKQVQTLATLGIHAQVGHCYHRGIINTATKSGEPLDAVGIYNHVITQVTLARAQPESELARDIQALLAGLNLCSRAQIALLHTPGLISELLRQEHQVQLAQLGTLVLPLNTITLLREPVQFVDTTGVTLGRLTEVLSSNNEASCSTARHCTSSETEISGQALHTT